jgi:hypothetical protein
MQKLIITVLTVGFFLSCQYDDINFSPELETIPIVIASGILNGAEWKGSKWLSNIDQDLISFTLNVVREQPGCPFENLYFSDIPRAPGTYTLLDSFPEPSTVSPNTFLSNNCGDAILGSFFLDDGFENTLEITSIDENTISGIIQVRYLIEEGFGDDVTTIFEFTELTFSFNY